MKAVVLIIIVVFSQFTVAQLPRNSSPEGARAYIISPKGGAIVSSPVKIIFGLSEMGVAPAGVQRTNTGHHHLLIDNDQLPSINQPLGSQVKHFGAGQTEVVIELAPGQHSLQLLLGDGNHIPHQPPVISDKITITVR